MSDSPFVFLFPLSLPHPGCPLLKSIIPKVLLYSYCFSAQEFKRTPLDPLFKPKLSLWHWTPFISVQFSSVAQSCPTLCDAMDCSMPSFPVHHQLQELTQTHVHQVSDAIQPSHHLSVAFSCLQSFLAKGSFPMSQFFTSGSQNIEASASASVFPMNIQDWFSLELTGLIFLLAKGLLEKP